MKSLIKTSQNPISEYVQQKKVPYMLIYHILTLILLVLITFHHKQKMALYKLDQLDMFSNMIMGNPASQSVIKIYTINQFQQKLQFLKQFKHIEKKMFQPININQIDYQLLVNYIEPYDNNDNFKKCVYKLDPEKAIKEPFDEDDIQSLRSFIYRIQNIEILINNIKIDYSDNQQTWNLKVIYEPTENYIVAKFRYSISQNSTIEKNYILFVALLIIAILSAIKTFKHLYFDYNEEDLRSQLKNQDKNIYRLIKNQKPWHKMRLKQKLLILDSYLIISLISYVFYFSVAIQGLVLNDHSRYFEYNLGFACFFACTLLLKFKFKLGTSNISQIFKILVKF